MHLYRACSLNGLRPFGVNPIIKQCGLGPKRTIKYHLEQDVTLQHPYLMKWSNHFVRPPPTQWSGPHKHIEAMLSVKRQPREHTSQMYTGTTNNTSPQQTCTTPISPCPSMIKRTNPLPPLLVAELFNDHVTTIVVAATLTQ